MFGKVFPKITGYGRARPEEGLPSRVTGAPRGDITLSYGTKHARATNH